MKRFLLLITSLTVICACDSGYLEADPKEELVVEGWIESGHAPMVFVSTTLPVSSEPQPLENIKDHILRYADVYVECEGERYSLTARLSGKHAVQNYFTSSVLRGEIGKTYVLHVKWQDYEAEAMCTIPSPTGIDSAWFEKQRNDTSYVAKIRFRNNNGEQRYYHTFMRCGTADENIFQAVNFALLDGRLMEETVTETFMKSIEKDVGKPGRDLYFHKGDCVAIKLATLEKKAYDFWASYANLYNGSSILSAPTNLKGNVDGAIGYWAGYGVSVRELSLE